MSTTRRHGNAGVPTGGSSKSRGCSQLSRIASTIRVPITLRTVSASVLGVFRPVGLMQANAVELNQRAGQELFQRQPRALLASCPAGRTSIVARTKR